MEQDFSFILLIVAGIVLLTLFIFSFRTRIRPQKSEPIVDEAMNAIHEDILVEPKQSEDVIIAKSEVTLQLDKPLQDNEKIIVMNILPQEGRIFLGQDVLQAFNQNQLHFGVMEIFHRFESNGEQVKILFSAAQATEPGTFDIEKLPQQKCKGLSLFMQLTGPEHNLKTYELFILIGQQIADQLKGVLVDNKHQALTATTTKHYKEIVKRHLKWL